MLVDALSYEFEGEELVLDDSGAIWLPSKRIILLADLHIGKTNHFRKEGIAIPQEVEDENFHMLDQVILKYEPKDVFFLGDLFHSEMNKTWDIFNSWMEGQPKVEFHLILGNHDILEDNAYDSSRVNTYGEGLTLGPFALYHHPTIVENYLVLCGHLHPVVRLKAKGKSSMRVPCFYWTREMIVLPAAGSFKGGKVIVPNKEDRVVIITKAGLKEMN